MDNLSNKSSELIELEKLKEDVKQFSENIYAEELSILIDLNHLIEQNKINLPYKISNKIQQLILKLNPVELKTSLDWCAMIPAQYQISIIDPDGWDRANWYFSYYDEKITFQEFMNRLMQSTISVKKEICNLTINDLNYE